jgi:hypothetical protein
VKATAFVGRGQVWQKMRSFELKCFSEFDFH